MQPAQPTLTRVLGPWMATAIVIGTVIGSGVFKKGRNVAENVPEFGLAMAVWMKFATSQAGTPSSSQAPIACSTRFSCP